MASENPSFTVKFEFIIFVAILLLFLYWVGGRCTRTTTDMASQPRDTVSIDSMQLYTSGEQARPTTPSSPPPGVSTDTISGGNLRIIKERVTPLYITIDGLNVRRGPGLNYDFIDRLALHDEVVFLNEISDSTQTIKLGELEVSEPWVKIRTAKGRNGWVFGAGVSYYKKELEGVEE
jgi:hypothetical protein